MDNYHDDDVAKRREDSRWKKFLAEQAVNDPPTSMLREDLRQLEEKAKRFASGAVNRRRSVLREELEGDMEQIRFRYQQNRADAAKHYQAESKKATTERLTKRTDTGRLADVMEAQLRFQSMSDDHLQRFAMKPLQLDRQKDDLAMVHFRNAYEYQALKAELQKRGDSELAQKLSERYSEIPKDALGDPQAAHAVRWQRFYETPTDSDTALTLDQEERLIGVPISECIDLGQLDAIPD